MTPPEIKIAARELRGDSSLYIFAALAMAMSAAALTAVLSLSDSFRDSLARDSRALLGGDLEVRLSSREFHAEELQWLRENSGRLSFVRTMNAMARAGESNHQLVRVKTADDSYPLFGEVKLQSGRAYSPELLNDENIALVSPILLNQLEVGVGDSFFLGAAKVRIADVLLVEPDPSARILLAQPTVLISEKTLAAAGLARPGSVQTRRARIAAGDLSAEKWRDNLRAAFPNSPWRVTMHREAFSFLRRIAAKFEAFLAVASLGAMLIAGVGAGVAVGAFLRARQGTIAVLKAIGAESKMVSRAYLLQILGFAILGATFGIVLAEIIVIGLAPLLKAFLPIALSAEWSWRAAGIVMASAILITLAFALPPLGRFGATNPTALFNRASGDGDSAEPPTPSAYKMAAFAAALGAGALAVGVSSDKTLSLMLIAGALAAAGILRGIALLAASAAEKWSAKKIGFPLPLKLALRALSRAPKQSAAGVVSLGLGVAALVAILETEANFAGQIDRTLSHRAPNFYLVGILPDQLEEIRAIVQKIGKNPNDVEFQTLPFLRGRIVKINGIPAEEVKVKSGSEWILRGERGITWSEDYIGGSRIVDGKMWDDSIGGPQVSFAEDGAEGIGIKIGDTISINALGREIKAVVANLRRVDWRSFDLNFEMIFSPDSFADAPHAFIGTLRLPDDSAEFAEREIVFRFPNVVVIASAPIFQAGRDALSKAGILARLVSVAALAAGILVLAAALAEGRRRRVREAVILRALGAKRKTAASAFLLEAAALATAAAIPAFILGTAAGAFVAEELLELPWQWQWQATMPVALAALLIPVGFGAADLSRVLGHPPLDYLRNE